MSNLFLKFANGDYGRKKLLLLVKQDDFYALVDLARECGLKITWRSGEEIWGINPFETVGVDELYIGIRKPKDGDKATDSDLVCSYFKTDKLGVLSKNYKDIPTQKLSDFYDNRNYSNLTKTNKKGKAKEMKMFKGIKGMFGAIDCDRVAMSMKGLAFKDKNGNYIHYDLNTDTFTDVSPMVFDLDKPVAYKVPVSLTDLKQGDIIMDGITFHVIKDITGNKIKTINLSNLTGSNKVVVENVLGVNFNMYSKVVPLFDTKGGLDFNNPMAMMLLMDNDGDDKFKDIMLMNAMANGNSNFNPMMLMLLDKGKVDFETIMMMNMMNGSQNNVFQNIFGGNTAPIVNDKNEAKDVETPNEAKDVEDK